MESVKTYIKNLTKREKVLLYVLLILIILIVGWFLVLSPALTTNSSLVSEKSSIEESIKANKITVDYGDLDGEIKTSTETLQTLKNNFYGVMETDDIDQIFTALAKQYSLTPNTLSISEITNQDVPAFGGTSTEEKNSTETTGEDNTAEDTAATEEGAKEADKATSAVYVCTVDQIVTGAYKNVDLLVDNIRANNSIHITSISYSNTANAIQEFSISYNVYMIEK